MTALILSCTVLGGLSLLAFARARAFSLERRVMGRAARMTTAPAGPVGRIVRPVMDDALARLTRLAGRSAELETRLAAAGVEGGAARYRATQVVGAALGVTVAALAGALLVAARGISPALVVLAAAIAGTLGALAPDVLLSRRVSARSARLRAELPGIAELLALAVAGGEGLIAALTRVERRADGALAAELSAVVAQARQGTPLAEALDALAARTAEPQLAAFAGALATAVERGTPLAEVLHAQASDTRERARQALMEEGGKREIAMLVPVVFLILPVTVLFALFPSLVSLQFGA